MKKIKLFILSGVLLLASCQDVLEREFTNPDEYGQADGAASGLFTGMIYQWQFYVKDYGEWYWQLNGGTGIPAYAQLAERYVTDRYAWFSGYDDLTTGNGFTDQAVRDWFNNFYVRLRNWGELRDMVAESEGQAKIDAQVYFDLATIMKDWAALRNVDLFNSIPYFDAFKGNEGVFTVKYDDPKEIYRAILDELKAISERLPAEYAAMSEVEKSTLNNQDIALKGDVTKWIQYANSVRLRAAIRLSGVDRDFAAAHIQDVLTKANGLPTTDLTWDLPVVERPNGGGLWMRGMYETSYATFIPKVLMDAMNTGGYEYEVGVDDPRLPVIALPTKWHDYRPVTMNADAQKPAYVAGERYFGTSTAEPLVNFLTQNSRSMYSHVTYMYNDFPAYMMSVAEIDLMKAEVAIKGLGTTGKSAGEHMHDATVNSINFWYGINALSTYGTSEADDFKVLIRPAKPDAGVITGYADAIQTKFESQGTEEDQMDILMLQKYVHINLIEPYELFTDLRRTRHPKLEPFTFGGKVMKPMPERLRYPQSEFESNTENYLLVRDQDNFTTPVFWVPANKINESYYQD
jgi:hypothetical protein